jgi:hypothetical protein
MALSRASRSVGAFAERTSTASSLYLYAVAWEIPKPAPSRRMSGRSRNHARVNIACFQQVRARVPSRVPISRRWSASSPDTNSTSGSGTSRMTR